MDGCDDRPGGRPCNHLFGRSAAGLIEPPTHYGGAMTLSPTLLEILACPEDKGPLLYLADEGFLYNPRLHRRYDVRDGIPVMLVDEATTVDDAEHERIVAKAG